MRELDEDAVLASARLAGVPVLPTDVELLTRTMRRYAEVAAPLDDVALSGVDLPPILDPRVGW